MKKKHLNNNEIIERFTPSITDGLSSIQVENRIDNGLVNATTKRYSKSYLSIFLGNFFTFFNLLGLIVAIALIIAKATISNYFFAVIFSSNILIGIIQEIRAKICIDRLSLVAKKKITVIRNGEKVQINSNQIVLDDVIMLGLGDQIPTDCILLDGNIEVNEALLTGESDAIKKQVGETILAGSFITSGTCIVIADKVGKDNYIQTLSAKAKSYKKPNSEIMNSLKFFIKTIGIIIVPFAVAFMLKSLLFTKVEWQEAILKTSTVVIGMIPSGMFLLTSLALAVGIIKLARHNTLVQDLYSLEMLARVNMICFDKTGTITDGKMTVQEIITLKQEEVNLTQVISSMNNALKDTNQTAEALLSYFGNDSIYNAKKVFPFNSSKKLSAVCFEKIGAYAIGAPEFILDKEKYLAIKETIDNYASQGLRVLALAHSNSEIKNDALADDFYAVALILIADNIRDDAVKTIQWFKNNGVQIKVISGDNPITVAMVSKRVGVEGAENYISLEGMSDEQVAEIATKYTVFGRVSPEQKAILIRALKKAGNCTAMTGDGINDLLALKEADCAITVASGSDATRNISHIILMDNNFNSMPKVVHEGRRVINNVASSASLYLMKTFFTMILALITLILPLYDTYPFELPQMIILEVLVIGVPTFFLALQPNDKKVEGKFISSVIAKSLPSSITMIFNVMMVEIFKLIFGGEENVIITMQVFALTYAGLISLFFICRPLNKFRTTLIISSAICITGIFVYSNFFTLSALGFASLFPLSKFWINNLFLFGVILLDFPILYGFKKLFSKIKIKKAPKSLNNLFNL